MTILTSLLGAKAFGFYMFLQDANTAATTSPGASPAASPADKGGFSMYEIFKNLDAIAYTVVGILLLMSVYSIAIMVERYLTFSQAKKQSREFAPRVAQALKNDRIEEAINISDTEGRT